MGMHAFVIDTQEAELAAAVDRANSWIDTARPVIKAYLALDQIHGGLNTAAYDRRGGRKFGTVAGYGESACAYAASDVSKAVEALAASIDGIRSDVLSDEKLNASQHADDSEWDRVEAFNDELDRQCMTVDAAVKLIGDAL